MKILVAVLAIILFALPAQAELVSSGSGAVTSFSGGTTGLTPATATTGTVTLGGVLVVANGGTGLATMTANIIYKGNGTGNLIPSSLTDTGTNLYTTENVGIGTASPAAALDVYGSIDINGQNALTVNLSSSRVAIGSGAQSAITSGTNDVAIGNAAESRLTTGRNDIAISGYRPLFLMQTGSYNLAIGDQTCAYLTSGNNNICIGDGAGIGFNPGPVYDNTMLGVSAGFYVTNASNSTFLGSHVAYGTGTTGNNQNSVFLGAYIGGTNLTGCDQCIIIGENVDVPTTAQYYNFMDIGSAIFGTGVMTGSPKIGIGTATPQSNLDVYGAVKTRGYLVSSLPSGVVGMRAYVTDQTTACPLAGAALTGSGAVTCPVFYNGSAWVGD